MNTATDLVFTLIIVTIGTSSVGRDGETTEGRSLPQSNSKQKLLKLRTNWNFSPQRGARDLKELGDGDS